MTSRNFSGGLQDLLIKVQGWCFKVCNLLEHCVTDEATNELKSLRREPTSWHVSCAGIGRECKQVHPLQHVVLETAKLELAWKS